MQNFFNLAPTTFFLCLFSVLFLQAQNRPFPQHETYTTGSIQPSNYTQAQMDAQIESHYDLWKVEYLKNDCGANEYYVEAWAGNNVSEGTGYGMMITAIMAGYDADAQTYFDGLYNCGDRIIITL